MLSVDPLTERTTAHHDDDDDDDDDHDATFAMEGVETTTVAETETANAQRTVGLPHAPMRPSPRPTATNDVLSL